MNKLGVFLQADYNKINQWLSLNVPELVDKWDWDDGGLYFSDGEAFLWIMPDGAKDVQFQESTPKNESGGRYLTRGYLYLVGLKTKAEENWEEFYKIAFGE